jgi:hypothetical protein
MDSLDVMRFIQMNGAMTRRQDDVRWFRLPRKGAEGDSGLFGYRLIGRTGLRIASTVVSDETMRRRSGAAHASGRAAG